MGKVNRDDETVHEISWQSSEKKKREKHRECRQTSSGDRRADRRQVQKGFSTVFCEAAK